jgi:cytidyltransferase-like protein
MIVQTTDLERYRKQVAMVDGGFDPLHAGHIEYFRVAAGFGCPVLCNVTSDAYVSGKHPPLLPSEQRVVVIDAIRYIDFTHLAADLSTADVLSRLQPRYYVKGDDWRGRLPSEETAVCDRYGIEVAFVETVIDSSTRILERYVSSRESRCA